MKLYKYSDLGVCGSAKSRFQNSGIRLVSAETRR